MGFVELHARSAFSFLRGASAPEALAAEAARLGLAAVALCDRDGFYGSVRLHMAARQAGIRALVGCELTMEDGLVVPVLVETKAGYGRLCRLLSEAHLRAPKGEGRIGWEELAADTQGLVALTGDEHGPLRRRWEAQGPRAAAQAGERLVRAFGPERVFVELQRGLVPGEEAQNDFLVDWARAQGLPLLASNGAAMAVAEDGGVLDVFTCLREHTTLDGAGRRLAPNRERHLKGAGAMGELFADLPEALANSERLAERLQFSLDQFGYRFPDYPVPGGAPQDEFLREMTYRGARSRYGTIGDDVRRQLDKELALIGKLGFSGYFLIVWDLCEFARGRGILVQGRGSAANSAVCYSLGITAVDPVGGKLLFERFLSEGRTDWPDIDLDLPSVERREEVIQEVYRRYGRHGAAMTANVITFRGRSAVREVGKAFGLPDDIVDRFSSLYHGGDFPQTLELEEQLAMAGLDGRHPRLPALLDTCRRVRGLPRHLGQHSGGMVLSGGELSRFVPLENARMPGRSVLQWDKTDCEDMGMVKIDLLGLGMMAVLQETLATCGARGRPVDLALIPKDDPETFRRIQEADTIGMFQIESRAQIATLPRMKPQTFYDLAIEVAIIRPGPIHGDAVNPYLERRAGREPVTYPDERTRPILERTLGIVLFQEQILRLAMEIGGFSAAEAGEFRRAIGFTRSTERLERMSAKFAAAMKANGVADEASAFIIKSISSFALYGFPESHAISFALIAYASAWLKTHRTPEFYAALLNCQPMGFYSPATLAQDARRHGMRLLPPCVQASDAGCRVDDDTTIRLGLSSVHGLRAGAVEGLVAARRAGGAFASLEDFLRRTQFDAGERRALAGAGALNALAGHRRAALWNVETQSEAGELFHGLAAEDAPGTPLKPMTLLERLQADYEHVALTTGAHPMRLLREKMPELVPAADLRDIASGWRVKIGGAVITRQRPGTAKGVCFITLEDETGFANAIVRPGLFEKRRLVISLEPALVISGRLQNEEGVVHVLADEIAGMPPVGLPSQASHDFR